MSSLTWSRAASYDLMAWLDFLEDVAGPTTASGCLEAVSQRARIIEDNPDLYGLSRFEPLRERGYHCSFVKGRVLVLRVERDSVLIVRFLDARSDYVAEVLRDDLADTDG